MSKQGVTRLWIACAVSALVLAAVFVVIGCNPPTPTVSPISPVLTPTPSPASVHSVPKGDLRISAPPRVAVSSAVPLAGLPRALAAQIHTGTTYLNWDDPTLADAWATIWADVPVTYTFVHQWRVDDGSKIIVQGTTSNSLASRLPPDGPGTGRFNGPITWTMNLGLFTGRAYLWERGCWEAPTCPLTATVALSYYTHRDEPVAGCPDVCMVNVPDPGMPFVQDDEGYWLTAYITGTGTLVYQRYLPLVLTK